MTGLRQQQFVIACTVEMHFEDLHNELPVHSSELAEHTCEHRAPSIKKPTVRTPFEGHCFGEHM